MGNGIVAVFDCFSLFPCVDLLIIPYLNVLYSPPFSPTTQTELEEVEPRSEEYPLTRAFITFLTVVSPYLLQSGAASTAVSPNVKESTTLPFLLDDVAGQTSTTSASFVGMVAFVMNSLFIKHTMRAYRDPDERVPILYFLYSIGGRRGATDRHTLGVILSQNLMCLKIYPMCLSYISTKSVRTLTFLLDISMESNTSLMGSRRLVKPSFLSYSIDRFVYLLNGDTYTCGGQCFLCSVV